MLKETLGRASAFVLIIPNQYFGIILYIMDSTFLFYLKFLYRWMLYHFYLIFCCGSNVT